MHKAYKIFWLAGESSGDLHSALIMKSLNDKIPGLTHIGIGGPRMQAQGLKPLFPFNRFAVMGFVEVLKHLGFFLQVQRRIKQQFSKDKPDLAILVDYPGLNLRIADLADEYRIPVLYFICPQFWAWKHERVYKLKASTRHVACILPFEKELLDIHNVTSSYVGHPIAEEVSFQMDRNEFARFYSLDPSKKWIGFFPGSRNNEIARMLPLFLKAGAKWNSAEYELLFSKSRSVNHAQYMSLLDGKNKVKLIDGNNYEMMKFCEVLVCTSGTVTLEAAFIGTPLIICYKASPLSYLIGRFFVRIKRIGLPNIVLDQDLLPELVQKACSPANIFAEANKILGEPQRNNHIRQELKRLKGMLSDKRPSQEMPQIIAALLKTHA
ncbi:MAG: lipid-A-disaccharide synthase [Candidatus Cloacimonas sp.]|jgi:lipid-A-disaccharide synthase|nr:lipid-A-disaccharide synthase [Candidatus Cloacimonas sp.]